ncbi:Lrp/AsnC family transcriptional regulator [Candidatus Woesearchaeota archaeon]|nr:Lrp/AsnC family transcriptional regulator [Candidatus Woesearchaeota archaeon]
MVLDKKDLAIIDILKTDARLSIRDIAKKTSIRPSTVHQRITKLKKDGVIEKFTVKLNNSAVGENFIVLMLIKTKPSTLLDGKIIHNKHVKEIFGVTGEYDLLLKLKFKDVEEFNDFVIKFRKEQQVETTLTMVATANIKEELN